MGDKYRITTPVNWQKGDKVIVHPSVKSGEEAEKLFPGYETVKVSSQRRKQSVGRPTLIKLDAQPYLRFAADPSTRASA
jgi:hypothetical protein